MHNLLFCFRFELDYLKINNSIKSKYILYCSIIVAEKTLSLMDQMDKLENGFHHVPGAFFSL